MTLPDRPFAFETGDACSRSPWWCRLGPRAFGSLAGGVENMTGTVPAAAEDTHWLEDAARGAGGHGVVAEPGDVDAPRRGVRGYKPTVLVLDLNIMGASSLEAIPAMTDSSPETAIVVVTMQEDPAFAREALRGAFRSSPVPGQVDSTDAAATDDRDNCER